MEHRRRGADFSHLLETFCSSATDCRSVESEKGKTFNIDRRTLLKSSDEDATASSGSFKSTILAGHAADFESQGTSESSYRTAASGSGAEGTRNLNASSESCVRLEAPSLMNRAINMQFSPQPELDLSLTSTDPRSSREMNRNIVSPSERSSDKSRDTNYNIKDRAQESPPGSPKNEVDGGFKTLRNKLRPDTPRVGSIEPKTTGSVATSPGTVQHAPDDESARDREKILRRLSQEFMYSPRTFTERLVTIIDESESAYAGDDAAGVNLSRMTKEFRKMCKFIQDESMPDMAPSLCATSMLKTSIYLCDNASPHCERPETIAESPEFSSVECVTPQIEKDVRAKKIYRKTPLTLFKKNFRENRGTTSPGSPNSTGEFEYWEKFCKGLPNSPINSEKKFPQAPLRRSLSASDISKDFKEKLMIRCKEQLRSLDDTNNPEFETFDSHPGQEAPEIVAPSSNVLNAVYDTNDEGSQPCAKYAELDEDELSNSLRIEKERQRQRCFETALMMQEIEEAAKKTKQDYPEALESHGIDPFTAFLETFNSCIAYKNCVTGMRQSGRAKRAEGSSVDSGVDVRSFGRTRHTSSKTSCEAFSRNSNKQNHGSAARNPRSGGISTIRANSERPAMGAIKKTQRKAVSVSDLCKESTSKVEKRSVTVRTSRNATFLRPPAKSLAPSRSPSPRKRSPTYRVPQRIRAFPSSLTSQTIEIRTKSPVPEKVVTSPSSFASAVGELDSPMPSGDEQASHPQSPEIKSLTPSLSPKNSSKDRVPKIANYRTEKSAKSSLSPKNSRSPPNRYFITPGRNTPVVRTKKPKTYFPSMGEVIGKSSQPIVKSLHAPGLYRLGYKTVISPISMYIRGTDMNLVQNNQERKNEMMLTPKKLVESGEKLKFRLDSKTPPSKSSPRRKCRLFDDKRDSDSDENDENVLEPGFAFPKTNYNLPAQVRTVNESPKLASGVRTRGLLQSLQSRVVVCHKEKRFEDNPVPENCSDSPTDMSIHVLNSAEKTNFVARRRL